MSPLTEPPDSPHVLARSAKHLEADISLAARHPVHVLITAPTDRATTIVQAIAARDRRSVTSAVVVCDSAAGDDAVAAIEGCERHAAAGRAAILWLKEVHRLQSTQQQAVMRLLADGDRPYRWPPRIIASSTVDLLGRVAAGAFDWRLFYRLNTIHIVVPLSGGEPRGTVPRLHGSKDV